MIAMTPEDETRIAKFFARRYYRAANGEHWQDLLGAAWEAVHRATQHFDPDRGVKFATYAGLCVLYAVRAQRYGNLKQIRLSYRGCTSPAWVDTFTMLNAGTEPSALYDRIEVPRDLRGRNEHHEVFEVKLAREHEWPDLDPPLPAWGLVQTIPGRDREFVMLHAGLYDRPYTQVEIAREYGISHQRVKQCLDRAYARLRQTFDPTERRDAQAKVQDREVPDVRPGRRQAPGPQEARLPLLPPAPTAGPGADRGGADRRTGGDPPGPDGPRPHPRHPGEP